MPSYYICCGCALANFSDSFFDLDLELNDGIISPSKGSDDHDDLSPCSSIRIPETVSLALNFKK